MKKLLFATTLTLLFLMGCTGKSGQNDTASTDDSTGAEMISKEILTNDSLSTEMDNAKGEIEKSAEKLDEALNNL